MRGPPVYTIYIERYLYFVVKKNMKKYTNFFFKKDSTQNYRPT